MKIKVWFKRGEVIVKAFMRPSCAYSGYATLDDIISDYKARFIKRAAAARGGVF